MKRFRGCPNSSWFTAAEIAWLMTIPRGAIGWNWHWLILQGVGQSLTSSEL